MGTRADFYVGRGKSMQWIGSIAWDGYPSGNPEPLLKLKTESEYRAAVANLMSDDDAGPTKPEQGWPWPWTTSETTDYAYAFDAGCVWGSKGAAWWKGTDEPDEEQASELIQWPEMSTKRIAIPGSNRSGLTVI